MRLAINVVLVRVKFTHTVFGKGGLGGGGGGRERETCGKQCNITDNTKN